MQHVLTHGARHRLAGTHGRHLGLLRGDAESGLRRPAMLAHYWTAMRWRQRAMLNITLEQAKKRGKHMEHE